MQKRILVLFLFLFLASFDGLATHLRGGQITFKRISLLTYQVNLRVYTDTRSPIRFGGGILKFADGDSIITTPVEGVQSYDPYIRIVDFSVVHTYKKAGDYLVSYTEPNLIAGILNLSNSVDTKFYMESLLVINPEINFEPIQFSTDLILQSKIQVKYSFSTSPTDTTSAIYSFELITPPNTTGYNAPESLKINQRTGLVTWGTDFRGAFYGGEYFFAVKVHQFDKSGKFYLGFVVRTFTVTNSESASIINISNPITDADGKTVVLPEEKKVIKLILSNGSVADSLRWISFIDPRIGDFITFTQYDSVTVGKKTRVGVLSISPTEEIERDFPYTIVLRGINLIFASPYELIAQDVSYSIFTKNVDFPNIPETPQPEIITYVDSQSIEVTIFPNPFSNKLFLKGTENDSAIEILNVFGQTVFSAALGYDSSIDTSFLDAGVYIAILRSGSRILKFKLFKE
jgi:hypothetical protein